MDDQNNDCWQKVACKKIKRINTVAATLSYMEEWSSNQLSLANERQEDWWWGGGEGQCGRTFDLLQRKPLGLVISWSSFPTPLFPVVCGSIEFPASLSTLFNSWLIQPNSDANCPRPVWRVDERDVKLQQLSFHHFCQTPPCCGVSVYMLPIFIAHSSFICIQKVRWKSFGHNLIFVWPKVDRRTDINLPLYL